MEEPIFPLPISCSPEGSPDLSSISRSVRKRLKRRWRMDEELGAIAEDINWLAGTSGGEVGGSSCSSPHAYRSFSQLASGHKVSLSALRDDLLHFESLEKENPQTDEEAFGELSCKGPPGYADRSKTARYGDAPLSMPGPDNAPIGMESVLQE